MQVVHLETVSVMSRAGFVFQDRQNDLEQTRQQTGYSGVWTGWATKRNLRFLRESQTRLFGRKYLKLGAW